MHTAQKRTMELKSTGVLILSRAGGLQGAVRGFARGGAGVAESGEGVGLFIFHLDG
jgi:hypothetical protein